MGISYSGKINKIKGTRNLPPNAIKKYYDNFYELNEYTKLLLLPDETATSIVDYSLSSNTPLSSVSLTNEIQDPWGGDNKVITLNGTSDSLIYDYSYDWTPSDKFTAEVWYYQTSTNLYPCVMSNWKSNVYNQSSWVIEYYTNTMHLITNNGVDNNVNFYNTNTNLLNQWVHFAFTIDNNTLKIYINGSLVVDESNFYINTTALNKLHLSSAENQTDSSATDPNTYFGGYIGAVRISNGEIIPPEEFMLTQPLNIAR